MRWTASLPRWLAAATAGLLSVSLVAALVHSPRDPADPPQQPITKAKPRGVVPLFATTQPAANPTELVVLPDERGLRGWVAGAKSFAGAKVAIKAGNKSFDATIGDDNTFAWAHTSGKPQPVALTLATGDGKSLTAHATLPAKPEGTKRTAFVITDRSAYRPGHTLKFVAYIHETKDGIDFKPLANQEFTVDITSETRQTRATRLKLRADDSGRLTGQYTFSDADSLDHYHLIVTREGETLPLAGDARVLLGEYRKTKVGLKLKGEVKDGKLILTFDARDYLDRPVKGTSATWSAVVSQAADVEKLALDPAKFIVNESGPPSVDDFNTLPDDERLLTLANGVSAMSFAGFGARTVAMREGKVEFAGAGDKPGTFSIDLWPEWLKGQHMITVNATFLDDTGRENRAIGTFSLTPFSEKSILVATSKEMYATSEKIPVAITPVGIGDKDAAATTVIVMKLEASPSVPVVVSPIGHPEGNLVGNTRIPPLKVVEPAAKQSAADGWKAMAVYDPVKRKVLTAVPVVNGKADVDLKQPGAYKLLAITRLADGTVLQSETGVVVKSPAKLPGVVLQLDSRELSAGSHLTGTIHTRFAGAKLLLTLRDASGVKLMKPITAGANGMVRFDEVLPPNLRYGCSVCVQYVESPTITHADLHDVFVIPTDRTITITTTTPDTVGPGADVKLNFQVDREEEVDLVVSVFDESLLGVSGDLSGNIRDFYLADTRGQGRAARDLTATRLGNVRIADLIAKAEKLLKNQDALVKEPGLEQRLTELVARWKERRLVSVDVVTLVRLAGFEVYLAQPLWADFGNRWTVSKSARLADLLRRDAAHETNKEVPKQYLSATVIDNTVLIGLADRNGIDPWLAHRGNFYQNQPCYGMGCMGWNMCGGFQCYGFQFSGFYPYGFSGMMGMGGFGGQISQFGMGFGGGFGGFGGIAGGFGGGFGVPSVAGMQGSFSYPGGNMAFSQPFVGGQMGMSFGFNRDFSQLGGLPGPGAVSGPMPGLGVDNNVVRRDFADSAFWTATLRTDKTGKATASFKMPDSLTNWRVQVTAVSPKLHVGSAVSRFKSSRPIMIWPMLPRAFTEGDIVSVFGTAHNLTNQEQSIRVHLNAENGEVLSQGEQTVKVPPQGNVAVYWTYRAGKPGMTDLLMSAKCDAGSDASLKKLPVVSASVPEQVTASGIVGKDELKLTLPVGFDPKSAQVRVTVAPTLAADLADTLPYLVEYPYGCVDSPRC